MNIAKTHQQTMQNFINPFPPLGNTRVWNEKYIQFVSSALPLLTWIEYGYFNRVNNSITPECSGLYMFVWMSSQAHLTPFHKSLPNIVYIGKTENLKTRMVSYLNDLKAIKNKRRSERKIRDSIRVMLEEYGNKLVVYYAKVDPTNITHYEDALIKLFDPVFNSSQRLNEDAFERYENSISASIESAVNPFEQNNEQEKKPAYTDPKSALGSTIGKAVPAF